MKRIAGKLLALLLCLMQCCMGQADVYWTEISEEESALLQQKGEEIIEPEETLPDYVVWLIGVAKGELGYTEQRNGYTKYGAWAGDEKAEWCAEFLCWCVNQVDETHGTSLLTNIYPKYSGTNVGLKWFLKEGRYIARKGTVPDWGSEWFIGEEEKMEANSYIPRPGDWMFFSTLASGDTTHVAMVEYCTKKQDGTVMVHVLEGNRPDKVQQASYLISDSTILGYGTVFDLADIVLRQGQEGKKVEQLQGYLRDIGLLEAQYVTGKYGQHTADAVRAFQKIEGAEQTGIANHHTQLALQKYVREWYLTHGEYFAVQEDDNTDPDFDFDF